MASISLPSSHLHYISLIVGIWPINLVRNLYHGSGLIVYGLTLCGFLDIKVFQIASYITCSVVYSFGAPQLSVCKA